MVELCTRRPVAVVMLTLAVLLFGLVSLTRLRVTLLPDLSYPTLTVRTTLAGAAPTEVETLLSKPIEETLGIIKGVRQVRSVSRAGQSDVTLEFNWGTKMDYAVLDVREKLDTLTLPKEAQRPIVLRFDPSQDPIVRLGMSLKRGADGVPRNADESQLKRLRRIAEEQIQRQMEGVDGVAAVKISGGLEDEIQVSVDLQKLSQFNLNLQTVAERLKAENANISGGRVDQGSFSYLVRTLNQFTSLDEIRDTIIVARADRPIYLKDIATVVSGYKERQAIIRIDGDEAVEIALYKEGDGNTVSVAENALKRIDELKKTLPPDLEIKTLYNQSVFIQQSINEVTHAAIEGGLLAVLIIYLFLRNAWTTVVIGVAIPVSVIATFNLMYGTRLSLNIMSLGGIALAIGLIVDDAIVVLENISRKREQGLAPMAAANQGAREVGAAVTASTLTTVAVFFPMVFVQGIAGQLFADQALVVTGALLFSLVVSFTLTPMMAARSPDETRIPDATPLSDSPRRWRRALSQTRFALIEAVPTLVMAALVRIARLLARLVGAVMRPLAAGWQRGYEAVERRYVPLLAWALDHRFIVLSIAAALFGFSLLLLTRIGIELIPPFSQGEFKAELTLPPGTPLDKTDALLREVAASVRGNTHLAANYSVAGTGNRLDANADSGGESFGTLSLVLKPGEAKQEGAVIDVLNARLNTVPGLSYKYSRPTLFTLKTPLEVEIAGYDLDALARVSETLRQSMIASGRYTEVKTTLAPGHPEIQVVFDQERAAALNLDTADLADRVVRAVQGNVATRYRLADREIDVLVRGAAADRSSVQAIRDLVINPDSARPVTLSAVADVRLRSGPSEIRRADQQRSVVVSANLASGDLGEAVIDLQHRIDGIALPQGVSANVAGQSEEMKVSFRSLQFALALAIFLVYLVMASQFESLVHPLVILFSIPLAAIGAIVALYVTGTVINVVALIGMIMLVGIVVKNGIILIDLVNHLREQGLTRREALLKAGPTRLRPILMTTLTAVLGLVPMAVGGGEGAEVRAPMAITVIGGLTVSTLLTLLVIPVVYTLLDRRRDERPAG
ncbi:MAG: efflux RND transporter permease subunit [Nevskiaceae bacterium]|nr:MAG: efflux RND transporter permease subunit [Nevskiaceae bacterium]